MISLQSFAQMVIWVPLLFYWFGTVALVIRNARISSTDGISYVFIFLWHVGVSCGFLYVFFLNLPFAYKVVVPLQLLTIHLLIVQEWYYASSRKTRKSLFFLHGLATCVFFISAVSGYWFPIIIGHTAGWIMTGVLAITHIPQMIKVWFRQTTYGYSLWSILWCICAELLELSAVIVLQLPVQSLINVSRRLAIDTTQLFQFYLYRKNKIPFKRAKQAWWHKFIK